MTSPRSVARGVVAGAFRGPVAAAAAEVLERLAAPAPNSLAVLTYHRVDEPAARPWLLPTLLSATPRTFTAQMEWLGRRRVPIGLPDLLAAHRGGRRLPPRGVLVTFDDAYRDFAEHAWPVLQRVGIPATLFVPTGGPDAPNRGFWWDRLWEALKDAPASIVRSPVGPLDLADETRRLAAARALVDHHKGLPHGEAMRSVDALIDRLRPGQPTGEPRQPDLLDWAELRGLAAAGVHLAPHSRSHPLLTRLAPGELDAELHGSREALARNVGESAFGTVLAYPSGQHSEVTREAVLRLGFELAFTTERGINRLGSTDPLRLRRINVGLRSRPELLAAQIAFFTLRYRTGRQ